MPEQPPVDIDVDAIVAAFGRRGADREMARFLITASQTLQRLELRIERIHSSLFGVEGEGGLHRELRATTDRVEDLEQLVEQRRDRGEERRSRRWDLGIAATLSLIVSVATAVVAHA